MARKDVELVFKAKDQAGKVVDNLASAIDMLVKSQAGLGKGSASASNALGALGSVLSDLDKTFKGMSGLNAIKSKIDSASKAFDAQTVAIGNTNAELAVYEKQASEAVARTEDLQRKSTAAATAQEKQAKAALVAREAESKLKASLAAANAERTRAQASILRLTSSIESQTNRVADAQSKYDKLGSAPGAATAAFQKRFESATATMDKANAKLAAYQAALAQSSGAAAAASAKIAILENAHIAATAAVAKETNGLKQAKAARAGLDAAVRASALNQRSLKASVENTKSALDKQVQELAQTEAAFYDIVGAESAAEAASAKLASTVRGVLLPEYGRLKTAMAGSAAEQQKQQAIVKALADEMNRVKVPTQAMIVALNNAKTAASASKQEITAYQGALAQLRNALRQAQAGTISYAQATQNVVSATGNLKNALAGISTARAAATMQEVATKVRSSGDAMADAAKKTDQFERELKQLASTGRASLSLFQRLRGQVLSFAASYVGFFAVVQGINKVIDTTGQLQGAQSRLAVAFQGDQRKVAQEMDFLRRNSERLGVVFGDLAGEYSKFAVATQGTNLEGANTRKIFLSVAEAARVNRTSTEDLKGVFTALTQIVSKGAVQMEELRQQLGDRLPGALQLMADGLGVSTAELIKMMEQGQVTSDALIGFADQLDQKFGPQLGAALREVTAEQGRLNDAMFNGFKRIGEGGFIDAITRLLRSLNDQLRSGAADTFFDKLSTGLAALTDLLTGLINNFDLVVIAASAFVGIKIAGQIPKLIALFNTLKGTLALTALTMTQTATGVAAAGTASAAASVGVRGLTTALRLLTSSTGIGLLITAVSLGLGVWLTSTNDATEAMNRHQKIVDQVKNAYDEAGGSVKNWAGQIVGATKTEVVANLTKQKNLLDDIRKRAVAPVAAVGRFGGVTGDPKGTVAAIKAATDAFKAGTLEGAKFNAEIDRIAQADATLNPAVATGLIEIGHAAAEQEQRVAEANATLDAMNGVASDATAVTLGLKDAIKDQADAAAYSTDKNGKFKEALDEIKNATPGLSDELERAKALSDLNTWFEGGSKAAQTIGELTSLVDAYSAAVDGINQKFSNGVLAGVSGGLNNAFQLLKSNEGYQPTAKYDVNAFRAGYGSDTVTLADGSIKKVTEGMAVSVAEANRDLVRRIGEFQDLIKKQIGGDTFAAFSDQQQAVLTDIAYNYGSLPQRIIEAIKTGDTAIISAAIKGLGSDNGGIRQGRQNQNAQLFANGGSFNTASQLTAAEKLAEEAQKKIETEQNFHAEQALTIANNEFEIKQGQLEADGKARQAEINRAIYEAENKAKQEGTVLTKAERAEIERTTGILYDQKNVKTEIKDANREAAAQEKIVNDLLRARSSLLAAMKDAQKTGDTAKYDTAKEQLVGVNAELDSAIAKALELWQTIKGPAADAAIAKIEAMRLKLRETAVEIQIDWKKVGDLFADGLVGAFDSFAQAVAEGQSIADSARNAFLQFAADFLREIAKMILKQIILNAISSFFGGGAGIGVAHEGAVVGGVMNRTRSVNPAIFANAVRYHTGGMVGLAPNEVPAILQRGEEVLPANDPRHAANGGSGTTTGASNVNIKSVLVLDPNLIPDSMSSTAGEKVVLAHIRANAQTVKSALGLS